MEIGKYILVALVITGLTGFTGCDESGEEKNDNAIVGYWVGVYRYEEEADNGVVYRSEKTYDDIRYAFILKFTNTNLDGYENDPCSPNWWSEDEGEITYNLQAGDKMIIAFSEYDEENDTTYTDIRGYDYILSGNELTLSYSWTDTSNGESGTWLGRYEKYTGSFPPTEWTTVLANDDYEPDDDVATATNLTVDGTEQDHVILITDTDWFTFSADSGTSYIIAATLVHIQIELRLFSANGDTELASDESNNNNGTRIDWTCTETSNYAVQVKAAMNYDDCGMYGISVTTSAGMANPTGLRKEKKTVRHGQFRR